MGFLILRWGLQKQYDEKGRDFTTPFLLRLFDKGKAKWHNRAVRKVKLQKNKRTVESRI